MRQKKCTKCREVKNIDQFHVKSVNSDGHASQCKVCRNAADKRADAMKPKSEPRKKTSASVHSMIGGFLSGYRPKGLSDVG